MGGPRDCGRVGVGPALQQSRTPPFEAALILPVPEAEALVGEYRLRHDRSAALGVPAHITINYPFVPFVERPAAALSILRPLLAAQPGFEYALSAICTFPGFLYLAPDPAAPFRALIEAVAAAFPDSPPYGGRFVEIIPHLTVAEADEADLPSLQDRFSAHAAARLPLAARAKEIWLMDNRETRWTARAVFPLEPPR